MADTQFIKAKVEPYLREWLAKECGGVGFKERDVKLQTGEPHRFDAVSSDGQIVADFVCNRAKTLPGNENTGAVRKVRNDLTWLNLLPATVRRRILVFTDEQFFKLMQKRGRRSGLEAIVFLCCRLPQDLAEGLAKVLDACSNEQTKRN
jgi:hypothetical protein